MDVSRLTHVTRITLLNQHAHIYKTARRTVLHQWCPSFLDALSRKDCRLFSLLSTISMILPEEGNGGGGGGSGEVEEATVDFSLNIV